MITINTFLVAPLTSMSMIHIGMNEVGSMTEDHPAVMDAHMGVCTAVAAVNHDEATLIHFTPTGHFQREPIENGYKRSAYQAFVLSAIHRRIPVDSDESRQTYLDFMTRCLDGKRWDVTVVFPQYLEHDPDILTPFHIYSHLEKFASAIRIRRDTSVRVTPERIKGLNVV